MQMCAVDKDVKREDAVDAVLLSICTQHRLRLDFQSDLKGGAEEMNLWKDKKQPNNQQQKSNNRNTSTSRKSFLLPQTL